MTIVQKMKDAFERNIRAITARPYIAEGTAVTKATISEGFTCEIEDGPWKLTVDLAEKHGGENAGPNPGVLGRGSLASCLAMCYVRWAAKFDVPLSNVTVEVQADYDARGEYGVADDVPMGYSEVRYIVSLESDAPEAEIMKVLNHADTHSSYIDVFTNDQHLRREVKISRPANKADFKQTA